MPHLTTDVAVIGGGPAGAVLATRLAQLGLAVCLIERARFPRRHVGESLTPGVLPMLASIGAAEAVADAGFSRVHEVSVRWDSTETVRRDPRGQGILVDRGRFDAALVAHAVSSGVHLLQPAQVRERLRTPAGFRLAVDACGERLDVDARFLADAGGRSAALPGRRRPTGPRTIALFGYWTGEWLPERPRIEAGEREWFWGVPIPDGTYNTLVFVDARRLRAEPRAPLEDRLRALLGRSGLMPHLQGARLVGRARAIDATPYLCDDVVGPRHIRVGDAALALDPISSSGVQKAIQTALSGAIVVNTLLGKPEASEAALRFYRDSVTDASGRHAAWAAGHYRSVGARSRDVFWTARAAGADRDTSEATFTETEAARAFDDDDPLELSAECRWEETPCLGARYVEVKPALRHPRLDGPLAYLAGHELGPLLRDLGAGTTSRELARGWRDRVPLETGLSIARWLSERGVLVPRVQ
jgi:flavin-dependent dehydrogenase